MISHCKAHPGEITLLTLGPLTNVGIALQRDPDFATYVKDLGADIRFLLLKFRLPS